MPACWSSRLGNSSFAPTTDAGRPSGPQHASIASNQPGPMNWTSWLTSSASAPSSRAMASPTLTVFAKPEFSGLWTRRAPTSLASGASCAARSRAGLPSSTTSGVTPGAVCVSETRQRMSSSNSTGVRR